MLLFLSNLQHKTYIVYDYFLCESGLINIIYIVQIGKNTYSKRTNILELTCFSSKKIEKIDIKKMSIKLKNIHIIIKIIIINIFKTKSMITQKP